MACPKNEEGRTGADAQTDENTTDRRRRKHDSQAQTDAITTDRQNQNRRSQTGQSDAIGSNRSRQKSDKVTTSG